MPSRRVIGIDAGGTKLLGGVVDEELAVHHRVHRLWRGAGRQETLDIFIEAVEEARAAAPDVQAIGFGIPSLVEWDTGVSRWSNHLPLADVRFRDLMSERLGLPAVVDNDANLALLAEHRRGSARDTRHAVLVALGTGIGSGLLLDGRIYRGATGVGAELGHVVLDLHGPDCPSRLISNSRPAARSRGPLARGKVPRSRFVLIDGIRLSLVIPVGLRAVTARLIAGSLADDDVPARRSGTGGSSRRRPSPTGGRARRSSPIARLAPGPWSRSGSSGSMAWTRCTWR